MCRVCYVPSFYRTSLSYAEFALCRVVPKSINLIPCCFPENPIILYENTVVKGDTVRVIEGEDLELTCIYKPKGKATTVWEIPSKGIKMINPHRVSKIDRTFDYIIYCTRGNSSQYNRPISIEVLYPPNKPEIHVLGPSSENKPFNLTCSADSNPPASFTWRHDPSYYAPVVSEGPVITISSDGKETTVYCIARNTMVPTNGMPVQTVASTEFHTTDDHGNLRSEHQSSAEGGLEDNGNDNIGLVAATVLGWVFAVIAVVVAVVLYLRIRVISQRNNGTIETRSPLFSSGSVSKAPMCLASNNQKPSERMKLSISKSSHDCSKEERPKVPERPPHTLPSDKVPLHSYIELQSSGDSTLHNSARPESEEIYEHIEDGMPDQRKRYEDLSHSDMDVKTEGKRNEDYLVPIESYDNAVVAE